MIRFNKVFILLSLFTLFSYGDLGMEESNSSIAVASVPKVDSDTNALASLFDLSSKDKTIETMDDITVSKEKPIFKGKKLPDPLITKLGKDAPLTEEEINKSLLLWSIEKEKRLKKERKKKNIVTKKLKMLDGILNGSLDSKGSPFSKSLSGEDISGISVEEQKRRVKLGLSQYPNGNIATGKGKGIFAEPTKVKKIKILSPSPSFYGVCCTNGECIAFSREREFRIGDKIKKDSNLFIEETILKIDRKEVTTNKRAIAIIAVIETQTKNEDIGMVRRKAKDDK